MKDKAIAKITDEAMKINDPVAFAIEEYLTDRCQTDSIARKILQEDKKLKDIYDIMWKEATKRKKRRCAFIPPSEGFAMIDEYYGFDQPVTSPKTAASAEHVNVLDLF